MKKSTVVFIEIGMLLGIILAAITVPRNTPLTVFAAISVFFFVGGNILLFKNSTSPSIEDEVAKDNFWPRIFKIFFISAVYWILCLLLRRL